jgi:hypothetical protein
MKRKIPREKLPVILWTDRKMEFFFTHAKAYPKPMWSFGRMKLFYFGLGICCVLLLLAEFFPIVYIPFSITGTAFLMFYLIDVISAIVRQDNFNRGIINGEAEVADTWNKRIFLKGYRFYSRLVIVLAVILVLSMILYIFLTHYIFNDGDADYPFTIIPLIVTLTSSFNRTLYPGAYYCAFLDLDEGMLFGNAVFSYDIMSGLVSTGKGNGFELYHEGKVVATGNILPDDMRHLHEILEIREKYRDMMN